MPFSGRMGQPTRDRDTTTDRISTDTLDPFITLRERLANGSRSIEEYTKRLETLIRSAPYYPM